MFDIAGFRTREEVKKQETWRKKLLGESKAHFGSVCSMNQKENRPPRHSYMPINNFCWSEETYCVNEKTSPNLAWVHQLHDIKNRRLCVASLNYTTFSITFETECLTLVSNRVTYVHGLPPSLPAIPPNSASSAGLHRHPASSSSLPPPPPPPPPRTHIFLLSPHYHDLSQTLTIKHPLNMILRDLETYRNQGEILEVRRKLAMACIECGQ